MTPVELLPGFERMLEVCRKYGLALYQEPPVSFTPVAGEPVAGLPCDPHLSAVLTRVSTLGLPEGFFLLPGKAEDGFDLRGVNEEWRRDWPEPFGSLLVFAKEQALAYYLATVPSLADEQGIQPVVWVDTYEDLYALPIASSVDRFFDTYSHSLERQVERLNFPWDVPDLVGRDTSLVKLLRSGRFDFLMETCQEAREWVGKVLAAST
ncbi:hypothetical protein JRI60_45035 [Archangium violaceum]|uniref:hypothetical protein n=1 Tax=Archangium violaceum TaxID=83451 RepID=UPI00194E5A52|nr:hypothetical protein [Archangium violaceum]QRN96119.1 hypothetical protein JRI60_45035 [Archangium violaceum]